MILKTIEEEDQKDKEVQKEYNKSKLNLSLHKVELLKMKETENLIELEMKISEEAEIDYNNSDKLKMIQELDNFKMKVYSQNNKDLLKAD